jgi:glycosyltransferase involved in cell wall biosynthesis
MKATRKPIQTASAMPTLHIALLTGGDDRSYAHGLSLALAARGVKLDFIGSDALDSPDLRKDRLITFLNLRGDQNHQSPLSTKILRIIRYYLRLVVYALTAKPRIFHILWNNKFEAIDRVALMLLYRFLGKTVVMTVHNVNAARRDNRDSLANRLSLRIQYHLCAHLFVHTARMKAELAREFSISHQKISRIPFGINNAVPRRGVSKSEARQFLGIPLECRAVLFFGQIARYKGLEYIVDAHFELLEDKSPPYLLIGGKVKSGHEHYWSEIRSRINQRGQNKMVRENIRFIDDNEIEFFMEASDAVVLPYVSIFQSGVPFLAYSFGIPVIATNVGSLSEDIIEGRTGSIVEPQNPVALSKAIRRFFESPMYVSSHSTKEFIKNHANSSYSWATVAEITTAAYLDCVSQP